MAEQHCVRCGPSSTPKGHSPLPFSARVCCGQTAGFRAMSIVTKRSPISAEHLLFATFAYRIVGLLRSRLREMRGRARWQLQLLTNRCLLLTAVNQRLLCHLSSLCHHHRQFIIRPAAITDSMGQIIINSVSLCHDACLSVCLSSFSQSHFLIDFRQVSHR